MTKWLFHGDGRTALVSVGPGERIKGGDVTLGLHRSFIGEQVNYLRSLI